MKCDQRADQVSKWPLEIAENCGSAVELRTILGEWERRIRYAFLRQDPVEVLADAITVPDRGFKLPAGLDKVLKCSHIEAPLTGDVLETLFNAHEVSNVGNC